MTTQPPENPPFSPRPSRPAAVAPVAARQTQPVSGARCDFRLVAIDLDGTLLRSDKRISVRTALAIAEAVKQGVQVVLASARPPRSVKQIAQTLKLTNYQVNYNGAVIFDPIRSRHIYHQPLDPVLVRKIIQAARKLDPRVVVSVEILDKWYTDHVDDTLPTETSRSFYPDFVGPLEAFWHVPTTKLMLLAPATRLIPIRAMVRKRFAGQIATAVSDDHLLQIMHPSVDKSHALAQVASTYGVAPEQVLAIGDAPNDTGMLRWAGMGVAMGNAWPQVQKAADVIAPSHDEDGVAWALHRFILGR